MTHRLRFTSVARRKPIAIFVPKTAALAAVLCMVAACREPAPDSAPDSHVPVVARFGDRVITTADVDARILALPPTERPRPGQDLDTWYGEQIRELVIEGQLRAEAEENGLAEDEAFRASRREAEKQIAVQLCLATQRPEIEEITEEALRAAYEDRKDTFFAPERRSVYNLFLRRAPGARAEIEALRDRVLGGESFQSLVAEHSDSETRHRDGYLGWMVPGRLPPELERVAFGLEEGVPSDVVANRDGFHLFYIDQILPARQLGFEEVRSGLHQRMVVERREAALNALEAGLETPPGAVTLDRATFAKVVQGGDGDAVVLHLGAVKLTLADLSRQLRQALSRQDATAAVPNPELAWQLLEQLRRRERIYLDCRTRGHIPEDSLGERLDAWQREALLLTQRQRRLVEIAGRDEARLRLFYDSNLGTFSKPPEWHVRRLRIPPGDRPGAVMARLEQAATQIGSTLEGLQAEWGGTIEDLGFHNLAELRRLQPKLPTLIAPLAAGRLAAPYRTEEGLEIAQVVARRDAEPLPFEEVRERVAAAYVRQYTHEVYGALTAEILQSAELQILPEGLAALRDAGLPQPDVSVQQLEELLEEL